MSDAVNVSRLCVKGKGPGDDSRRDQSVGELRC